MSRHKRDIPDPYDYDNAPIPWGAIAIAAGLIIYGLVALAWWIA